MKFHVRTTAPLGRNTWEPDLGAKVQNSIFTVAAVLAAANKEAEDALLRAVQAAKDGILALPIA